MASSKRAICSGCNQDRAIQCRGMCKTCFRRGRESGTIQLLDRGGEPFECKHCHKIKRDKHRNRGLCRQCYDEPFIRDQYAPMSHAERGGVRHKRPVYEYDDDPMPTTVFAVTRVMRSWFSGVIPVFVKWFVSLPKAIAFAEKHRRRVTLRVERWSARIGRGECQEVIAVYPRRGGKRVAA